MTRFLLIFAYGLFGAFASAATIEFDLMHTRPECKVPNKRPTFCTKADAKALAAKAGMEARASGLIDLAEDVEKSKIVIAYYSFSNMTIFNKLCEKGKQGFKIEGFFDNDYKGEGALPTRLASECQGPDTETLGKNVKVYFLGDKVNTWRLHHNKFLIVDPGNGTPLSINFSSGNLSPFGLSAHFDHWVLMRAAADTNVATHYLCVVDALKAAVKNSIMDNPVLYRNTLNGCLKEKKAIFSEVLTDWIEKAIAKERIAPFFSPNPTDQIAKYLVQQINSVVPQGKIYGCMQHFTHPEIATALKAAANRGVKVQLLMDDDVVTGQSEVPRVGEFYKKFLKPTKMQIRFMQTNAGDIQMMHNKFLVLEGVKVNGKIVSRVFSGAGHFTTAGMKNNYENFALTQVDSLTLQYRDLYTYMLPNSMNEDEAIKGTQGVAAAHFSPFVDEDLDEPVINVHPETWMSRDNEGESKSKKD